MSATDLSGAKYPNVYGDPEVVKTISVDPVTGNSNAAETMAGINQTYRRSVAGGAGSGNAVLVSGVTTAGTVTLTLANGGTAVISVPLGSSIWPFSTTAAALGTAVGGSFTTLFFT